MLNIYKCTFLRKHYKFSKKLKKLETYIMPLKSLKLLFFQFFYLTCLLSEKNNETFLILLHPGTRITNT